MLKSSKSHYVAEARPNKYWHNHSHNHNITYHNYSYTINSTNIQIKYGNTNQITTNTIKPIYGNIIGDCPVGPLASGPFTSGQ
ncbi:hypothetical protein [Acanthamoeba polyphaga mimivirus]|uniref:Uncharacterized protein n=5 Tax=Megamimivirinae TaxID=3044648 RepID=A0A2L2DLU8_MIMIV|nr:hypothetical protein MegaChil _gp0303 [Megavirus chiliensis]AEX61406.1 hypothetical protein c7_R340 [Megavirus courdo7]AFX92338.1 hypothetical protein CE11_00308 [Megavirus courdo11]AGD92209.1 hypothetical protein LBA_00289 [Megavirus lba]AVG46033.1 hypothetical protein [Acanthamoeba polyphaga mimivirus]AVL93638.1 hypothetical protein mvi_278 [Megavirus vitis]